MEDEVKVSEDTTNYKALYEETKAEAEAKAGKVIELEWLIQKHKGKKDKTTNTADIDVDSLINEKIAKIEAEKSFYNKNPELTEYKDKINEFTSNWYTLEHAKFAVINDDPTIQNRAVAQQSNFTNWTPDFNSWNYTQDQMANMPFAERKKIMDKVIKWEATIS